MNQEAQQPIHEDNTAAQEWADALSIKDEQTASDQTENTTNAALEAEQAEARAEHARRQAVAAIADRYW